MQYTPIRYTIDWWNHKTPGKSIMGALDGAFIHFRNGNARKSSKFQKVTKRVTQFPNSLSAILYLSLALRFLHSTLFFFFLLLTSIHRGPVLLLMLGPLAGQSIKFFLCPRRSFCMRRQDGGIHRIHKYARAPDTKKSPARRLQRFKTFTLQGAKDEAVQRS